MQCILDIWRLANYRMTKFGTAFTCVDLLVDQKSLFSVKNKDQVVKE